MVTKSHSVNIMLNLCTYFKLHQYQFIFNGLCTIVAKQSPTTMITLEIHKFQMSVSMPKSVRDTLVFNFSDMVSTPSVRFCLCSSAWTPMITTCCSILLHLFAVKELHLKEYLFPLSSLKEVYICKVKV